MLCINLARAEKTEAVHIFNFEQKHQWCMDILCCVLSVVWCYVMLCCVRSCCVMLRYVHTPQMGWEDSERTICSSLWSNLGGFPWCEMDDHTPFISCWIRWWFFPIIPIMFPSNLLSEINEYLVDALEPWNFMTFHSVGKKPNWRVVHHFSEG